MKVWDLATRLYHWIQAAVFIELISTGFLKLDGHIPLGLLLFTLIIWRIVWGFNGSETSRFRLFLRSPREMLRYISRRSTQTVGHNPIGAIMVVTLILALLLQSISGLALAGLLDRLPMAEWWLTDDVFFQLESMHFLLARVLPILVFVHVGAIIVYKLMKKPLLKAMITGYQPHKSQSETPYFASNRRAFLVLIAAGLVTMTIIAVSMV